MLALLLQHFQPFAQLADFGLALLQALFHAADLLGLRINQAAGALEFNADLSQAFARLRELGFGLIGLLARQRKRFLAFFDRGMEDLAFLGGLMQLIGDSLGFLRQQVVAPGESKAQL